MEPITLAPDAPIDLQMHTTFSDGVWTASELLDHVAGEGFALIAVTDHERPDTSAEIQRLAAQRHPGLHVLAAVEMSASWNGLIVDLLCFGFDPADNALMPMAESVRRRQRENIRETYATLVRAGYRFPRRSDLLVAPEGEPDQFDDLITLMQEHGYGDALGTVLREAGFQWITEEPDVIADAAHRSGAVCLIAHPGRGEPWPCFDAPQLDRFRAIAPVDGLEVYHPSHTPEASAAYISYAERHGLLISAGSDSHGQPSQMPIKYPAEVSRRLLERLGFSVG